MALYCGNCLIAFLSSITCVLPVSNFTSSPPKSEYSFCSEILSTLKLGAPTFFFVSFSFNNLLCVASDVTDILSSSGSSINCFLLGN